MALFAAVVHTMDDVQLLTAGTSLEEVTGHVARYVGERAEHMLWPADAVEIHRRREEGRSSAAVELYFSHVGKRWDREYLRVERVGASGDDPPRARPRSWTGQHAG